MKTIRNAFLSNLSLPDSEAPDDDYTISYLHFDLRLVQNGNREDNIRTRLGNDINAHMLVKRCYDPRRQRNFVEPMDEDDDGNPIEWTIQRLREHHQSSAGYCPTKITLNSFSVAII